MMLNLLPVLDILLVVAVSLRIFSRRSAHGTAVAWLLLVILLPGIGALMYLLIGERRLGRVWMQRALALRPQVQIWAEHIPVASIASPTRLSSGGATAARQRAKSPPGRATSRANCGTQI